MVAVIPNVFYISQKRLHERLCAFRKNTVRINNDTALRKQIVRFCPKGEICYVGR